MAKSGNYEIVSIGSSTCGGGSEKPIDSSLMKGQGFTLVGVRGTSDKKAEIWIRKNSGQSSVRITGDGKDVAWNITAISGSNLNLNFSKFTVATYSGNHGDGSNSSAKFKTPSGSGFTLGAFFFDDSVELKYAGSGDILYKTWGFGDGDGFAVAFFQPDQTPPSSVKVNDHDGSSGGEQFVTVAFKNN